MVRVTSGRLRVSLRQGTVYLMSHPGVRTKRPHFFIVVNSAPLEDEVIVLAVVTSNVQLRQSLAQSNGNPPETIVVLGHSDYPVLSHDSCIDCNDPKILRADVFEANTKPGLAKSQLDLPPAALARVVDGILASPAVSDDIKALVRPAP